MILQSLPPLYKLIGKQPPPGPIIQAINAAIHRCEPLSCILYGLFWSILLLLSTPCIIIFLQFQMIIRIILYYYNKQYNFHPNNNNNNLEMAIVITGCGKGFGKEIAFHAANMGYTVFAGCNKIESLSSNCILPDRVIPVQMDVTDDEQVRAVVEKVRKWINNNEDDVASNKNNGNNNNNKKRRVLHALINNAGRAAGGLVDWCSMDDYKNVMEVNYFGLVRCCKEFLPIFKEQAILNKHDKYGMRILNITSTAGFIPGLLGFSPYCGSKCAANSFTSALRQELKYFNIQVTTICPSFHTTNMVTSLDDKVDEIWYKQMNETLQKEYGDEYFKQFRFLTSYAPNMVAWDAKVVIEKVIDCLIYKTIPAEILIGSDAKFSLPISRMVPAWCSDFIASIFQPTTPPAIMMKTTTKKNV